MNRTIKKYILLFPLLVIFCLCGTFCVFIVGNLFSASIEVWRDGFQSGFLAWLLILGHTIWNDLTKTKKEDNKTIN